MTRFLITLSQAVEFVLRCTEDMMGGEIFLPKIPSVHITDLARVVAPECQQRVIGIRPGEKLHEVMVPEDDAHLTLDFDNHFVIQPSHSFWNQKNYTDGRGGKLCPDGFRYGSDNNVQWLTDNEIRQLVALVEAKPLEPMPIPEEPTFVVGG